MSDLWIVLRHDDAVDRRYTDIARAINRRKAALGGPLPAETDHFGVTGFADADAYDLLLIRKWGQLVIG